MTYIHGVQTTSLFAYHSILPVLKGRRKAVYDELSLHDDITNGELSVALGWQINCVTPRTNELVKMGVVVEARKRNCAITGSTCIAWRIKS